MSRLVASSCASSWPDPALGDEARNDAVHRAALAVSDHVAAVTRDMTAPETEVFELGPVVPSPPRVVYICRVRSPLAMSGSPTAFGTATYGLTRLTPA